MSDTKRLIAVDIAIMPSIQNEFLLPKIHYMETYVKSLYSAEPRIRDNELILKLQLKLVHLHSFNKQLNEEIINSTNG